MNQARHISQLPFFSSLFANRVMGFRATPLRSILPLRVPFLPYPLLLAVLEVQATPCHTHTSEGTRPVAGLSDDFCLPHCNPCKDEEVNVGKQAVEQASPPIEVLCFPSIIRRVHHPLSSQLQLSPIHYRNRIERFIHSFIHSSPVLSPPPPPAAAGIRLGKFIPTLLADNLTLSSSSISIPKPGLYRSSSVAYMR